MQVVKIKQTNTPSDTPPFTAQELAAQLQAIWENKHFPSQARNEAFRFLAECPPSERLEVWRNRATDFLKMFAH